MEHREFHRTVKITRSAGEGFTHNNKSNAPVPMGDSNIGCYGQCLRQQCIDINGDGLTDGMMSSVVPCFYFLDVNGDGLPDGAMSTMRLCPYFKDDDNDDWCDLLV